MSESAHRTPGQLIEDLLKERGWSQRVLALVMGTRDANIHHILSGRRSVDAEIALALGDVFGVAPEQFLGLQQAYDLAKARVTVRPAPERARLAKIYGSLPIAEMVKRGWLPTSDVRDVANVERGLERLFGTPAGEIPELDHAAKKTAPLDATSPAQLAWLHRAHNLAATQIVARPYRPELLKEAIAKLDRLLAAAPETRHVPRIMSEAGVRFVIVEGLSKGKIDGATMWLNPGSPVVAMSLRFDRIDNFWFVLRHELEHVARGHGRPSIAAHNVTRSAMVDTDVELFGKDVTKEEQEANDAAAEFCVPKKELEQFILRKAPIYRDTDVLGFAARIKVHPGIVAGQLRNRLDRWDLFTRHLVKVRHEVTPGATVDGWGDIAPEGD